MECPRCKNKLSYDKFLIILHQHEDLDIPLEYQRSFVLFNHESFRQGLDSSLKTKKQLKFFENDHSEKNIYGRPIFIRSPDKYYTNYLTEDNELTEMCLLGMKFNHVYDDHQLCLWIVTKPEPTNLVDGTIYMVVRDKFDFHIRLVIRNWTYVTPKNEHKTFDELSYILNELLPIDSMIKLTDPLLVKCEIDKQLTLRCDSPNVELILSDRIKKYFITEKLDEVRSRGNQSYIHGNFQLAHDYYSFSINRIIAMTQQVLSKDDECEINLFRNSFSQELSRLHSNRSSCYLQEHIYSGASLDSFLVVTGRIFTKTFDEYFLKCLYRLLCANMGLQDFSLILDSFYKLSQNDSIDFTLRLKYYQDFDQIQKNLPRLRNESEKGKFDLIKLFDCSTTNSQTFFNIEQFHSNFKNKSYLKTRNDHFYAKLSIPAGTLLFVESAFASVQTKNSHSDHRLLNEIEKQLIMSPNTSQFDSIRSMPVFKRWLNDQTDFDDDSDDDDDDDDDSKIPPKTFPWALLLKTQQTNPFRSKSIVGWWPQASAFKLAKDTNKQGNCFWFICDKMLFIYNLISIPKNGELLIASNQQIESFLREQKNDFTFSVDQQKPIRLNELFSQLEQTQIYFK